MRYRLIKSERADQLWLGKLSVVVAWTGLLLAAVSPPHGTGIPVCWLDAATGIPCPGCGLTRSLSCGFRGMFEDCMRYHPMGLVILALFVFIAAQSLLPRQFQHWLERYLRTHAAVFNAAYAGFVALFVAYGVARALLYFAIVRTHSV